MLGEPVPLKKGKYPIQKGKVVIPDFPIDYVPPTLRVTVILPQFKFDYSQMIVDITEKMIGSALSKADTAKQIGIPLARLNKVLDGYDYEIETFIKLVNWLGNNPARYTRIFEMKRTQEKMRGRYEKRSKSKIYREECSLEERRLDGLYGEDSHPLIQAKRKLYLKDQYEPKGKETKTENENERTDERFKS